MLTIKLANETMNWRKRSLWSLICGQSSDAICTQVEAVNNFNTMEEASAGLELLTAIQVLMFSVQEQNTRFFQSIWLSDNSI